MRLFASLLMMTNLCDVLPKSTHETLTVAECIADTIKASLYVCGRLW